jgi:hypothetical protein
LNTGAQDGVLAGTYEEIPALQPQREALPQEQIHAASELEGPVPSAARAGKGFSFLREH